MARRAGTLAAMTVARFLLALLVVLAVGGGPVAATAGAMARVAGAVPTVAMLAAAEGEEPAAVEPADLRVWNHPVATFRAPVGWNNPDQRVDLALQRLAQLSPVAFDEAITLKPADIDGRPAIQVWLGAHFLFGLTPGDLDRETGETLDQAAARAQAGLEAAFAAQREQHRLDVVLRGIAVGVAATVALALLLWAISRLRRRWAARLTDASFASVPPVFGVDLRFALVSLSHGLLSLVQWLLALSLLYLWLTVVLDLFPYTRPWAAMLGSWLLALLRQFAHGLVAALPGLVTVAFIAVLSRLAVVAVGGVLGSIEDRRLSVHWMAPETAKATRRVVVVLIWLFAITVAYPYLPGSSSDAFKGVSVFAGLMLTLGSSGMVNQVMSGLVVAYSRALSVGDVVKIGDVEGTVVELGFLTTRVRTPRREVVSIPNAVLVSASVTNYSAGADRGMVVSTAVTIGYDAPWRQVHALLQLAASRTPGLRHDPPPEVVQRALDDFYVGYELRARLADGADRFATLSLLHAQIQDAFNEHGVQIMSPHFNQQPAQAVVVPKDQWNPPVAQPAGITPAPGGVPAPSANPSPTPGPVAAVAPAAPATPHQPG